MKKDVSIIGRKTVWEGKFLRCVITTYIDSKGAKREWEFVERVNCKGIVVIVPEYNQKVCK